VPCPELLWRIDHTHLTGDEEPHTVTELLDVAHVVSREEDGLAPEALVADEVLLHGGIDWIQACGRLIEKQHVGLVQERPHEVEAHLHALGVIGHAHAGCARQTHALQ
jgi:hypothetical protein